MRVSSEPGIAGSSDPPLDASPRSALPPFRIKSVFLQLERLWEAAPNRDVIVGWLLALSVLTFAATLILIPYVLIRLPADYFCHGRRLLAKPTGLGGRASYWLMLGLKNIAGAVFVLVGVTMLVLPGQGLLTILVGLSLLDFPGKYRLERFLVTRPVISRGLNWLRRRSGKPPFELSAHDSAKP
jgi:hypothetical protein